jgi:hypothetical protein
MLETILRRPELEDASRIFGATRLRALVDITAPLIRNGMIASWIFIFIGSVRFRNQAAISLASTAEHGNAERAACDAQFLIERGQRKAEPLRQFKIRRVIEREPTAFGQVQSGCPSLMIRLGIDGHLERTQIGNRSVAERRGDPIAPYRHLQRIGDFQPPERWSNRA